MPFDPTDVRSRLSAGTPTKDTPTAFAGAEYLKFYEMPPVEIVPGGRTWYGRAQNFVFEYTELDGDLELSRVGQPDEYVVLLPDKAVAADITVGDEKLSVQGDTLVFVPPGDSTVRLSGTGRVIRLLTWKAVDLMRKTPNTASYADHHPNVADLEPWPDPVGGYKLRSYSLDVPPLENPPFRIFRCTTFMVNYIKPQEGPRDPAKLSPHVHDDFEQVSLVIDGEYVHHIRWPWTTDIAAWRPDDHERCASPHVCVIPPPAIHTSQAIGAGTNHLIDLFCPPRVDFSRMEGWILNADDYPASAKV